MGRNLKWILFGIGSAAMFYDAPEITVWAFGLVSIMKVVELKYL